jgi:hypothetical protein
VNGVSNKKGGSMRRFAGCLLSSGCAALTVAFLCASSTPVLAQAWTPAQGEGTVAVQFQDAFVKYHQLPTARLDRGHIRGESLLVDFTYGLTDKVAVSVALPYVASKYNGPFPHIRNDGSTLDTGASHSTFQDFRFDVRYNVSRRDFVLTPFVGSIVPSHSYDYFAHSAVGRHVREVQVGTYWAKLLDPVVPGLFVEGRYSFGFAQRILDISHNRSNLDLEVGYFVKPELRVFALGTGQLTHGGLDLYGNSRAALGDVLYWHHDQISRDNLLNVGAGAAYDLSPSVGVYGSFMRTVAGRNVHALDHGVTVGMTWSFVKGQEGARASRRPVQTEAEGQQRTLARCVCQKAK